MAETDDIICVEVGTFLQPFENPVLGEIHLVHFFMIVIYTILSGIQILKCIFQMLSREKYRHVYNF